MNGSRTIESDAAYIIRSTAHAVEPASLRPLQRFAEYVTDLQVARVMYALERGTVLYRSRLGRWLAPTGSPVQSKNLSPAVMEMIRTGLLRHWVDREGDHLIPAKVHLNLGGQSACHFVGEDMGPMRSRLVADLALVDCLHCCDTVARGEL